MRPDTQSPGAPRLVDADGLALHVLESGVRVAETGERTPVVVFVHGFPDTHEVWGPVASRLADRLHCVTYDVRGAGESGVPTSLSGYAVAHLVSDLVAVVDAVSPTRPVHLVGHDWGSVQAWEAVLLAGTDARLSGRISSYTTISGPAIGHFATWVRGGLGAGAAQRLAVLRQLAHSWYILGFQLPGLPELALRRMLATPERALRFLDSGHAAPTVARDAVNGVGLYRANLRGAGGPRHSLRTDLPVQLIVATRDPFLTPAVYADLPRFCPDLTRHDIDAGHWVQQSHPDEVARLIADFVRAHEPTPGRSSRTREDSVQRFVDDDEGYLGWLAANPDGY